MVILVQGVQVIRVRWLQFMETAASILLVKGDHQVICVFLYDEYSLDHGMQFAVTCHLNLCNQSSTIMHDDFKIGKNLLFGDS